MSGHKFDPAHVERLADPARLRIVDPELLWDAVASPAASAVVDLGAGAGLFAAAVAAKLPAGGTVWACDVAEPMVRWMRERLPAAAGGRVVPMLVEESRIGLPDASVDVVYSVSVFHELADAERSMRDVLRLLRPGGVVAVADWRKAATPQGPPMGHRVDAEEITAVLRRAGFVELRSIERLPQHSLVLGRRPPAGGTT